MSRDCIILRLTFSAAHPSNLDKGTKDLKARIMARKTRPLRAGRRLRGAATALAALSIAAAPTGSEGLTERDQIVHLLSRAAFGPTPAELTRVEAMGREAWIEEQLAAPPGDEPEVAAKLSRYPTLGLSPAQLFSAYPPDCPSRECSRFNIPEQQMAATVIRAVHSRYQLREVMVDFWTNHFNVFAFEGPTPYTIQAYLQDAIRPHALGRFEDLLVAVAQSAAMLYYLDNYLSTREGAPVGSDIRGGINENYARELMELHTVSVAAGYTQQDVIEVAKLLTGWTFRSPRDGNPFAFQFIPEWHEGGGKTVLGRRFDAGGQQEGLDLLSFLAHHPSTADNLIAPKLVSRFVRDAPPSKLVKRVASAFKNSGGDIAATLRVLLKHQDFYKAEHVGAKSKAPLELVAGAARGLQADVNDGTALARAVAYLGQPLLGAHPPTGWPDVASEVVSAGGMLNRFALADVLVRGRFDGIRVDLDRLAAPSSSGNALADQLIDAIVLAPVSDDTRQALRQAAHSAGASRETIAGLVLSSPEFQAQ